MMRRFPIDVLQLALGLAVVGVMTGCESSLEGHGPSDRLLVLSAFPAELNAVLAQAHVESTVEVEGRFFRMGTLGDTPVVIGMTGIGIANAAETSRIAFDAFDVIGAVFSGVAGSYLRIGDVAVPDTWSLADGTSYASDPAWLNLAREIAEPGVAELEECTTLPSDPGRGPVCLTVPPVIVVGGQGVSSGFEETLVGCTPAGGAVFGCDVAAPGGEAQAADQGSFHPRGEEPEEPLAAADMESAAVAREATRRGLRFIAFRAVSDGAGDPLNLPGFPAQFFAYYDLAAINAAGATTAFMERLAAEQR